MSRSSNDVRQPSSSAPEQAGSTRAPWRSSTSAASPTCSSPKDRSHRRCASGEHDAGPQRLPPSSVPALVGAVAEPHRAGSCSAGSRSWGCRSVVEWEVTGFAQDEDRRRRAMAQGGRCARSTSSGPTAAAAPSARGRHRFRRPECHPEQPDRGGRGDRGAPQGLTLRRTPGSTPGTSWTTATVGVPRLSTVGTGRRADPRRPPPHPEGRVRHRLRGPPPDLDLANQRRDPAGDGRPGRPGADRRGRGALPPPSGGQGIGLGVQDAVNLGGSSPRWSGAPRRRPAGHLSGRAPPGDRPRLNHTMAQSVVQRADAGSRPSGTSSRPPAFDGPRWLVGASSPGWTSPTTSARGCHPLLGRRMPDLDLFTPDGRLRVYTPLHKARPAPLNLGSGPGPTARGPTGSGPLRRRTTKPGSCR